jgi:uncharacterized protein YdhG (YjbR/CyaY superfamily)
MPTKKTTAKGATKSTKRTTDKAFSPEERAAMKERAREVKTKAGGDEVVLAKIAEMSGSDRASAEKIHALVRATAPDLVPKLWYGMPAYANDAGKVVCFFQASAKFKTRYATFAFNDAAKLDDGAVWPTAFAVTKLSEAEESKLRALVRRAVS